MANRFGETLSRLRTKRGLSQQELAYRLHVTRSAVANWEAGHRIPAASTIMQIAQLLDVEVALLLATAVAFLDIELGKVSGLALCQELLRIQPNANMVFLTAYREYSLDAWGTDACGYLLKPIEAKEIRKLIPKLRHPVRGLM